MLKPKVWETDVELDEIRLNHSNEDDAGGDPYQEEEGDHSQLPTVEEVKTAAQLDKTSTGLSATSGINRKKCLALVVVLAGILVISLSYLSLKGKSKLKLSSFHREENQAIQALVELKIVSGMEVFEGGTSHQSQALKWIVNEDERQLPLPTKASDPFVQRFIAAVFVSSLVPAWHREYFHFLTGVDECLWHEDSAQVNNEDVKMGFLCDVDGSINTIRLQSIGLTGRIPEELRGLPELTSVVLDLNKISGDIPQLPQVRQLSLAFNQFTGGLSNNLWQMTNLEELSMAENDLKGWIPSAISRLTNLKRLALHGNGLIGGISHITGLTDLEEIFLGYNTIDEELSNGSFGKLKKLRILDLNNNKLIGPFPDALWNLPELEVINFHRNNLVGHITEVINTPPPLKYIDIAHNFLEGGLPTSINRFTALTHLDVTNNRFEEKLPTALGTLSNLETLLLTENELFGPQPIPAFLEKLTNLHQLSLRLTARTGTIPDWFSKLTHLSVLDLDWNRISGTIPTHFRHLDRMEHMMLNRNLLEGTIPSELSSMPDLKTLMLDNNKFHGYLEACQVRDMSTDCGDPSQGCPNCDSNYNGTAVEVDCPCCTICCFEGDDGECNIDSWLPVLENDLHGSYPSDTFHYMSTDKRQQG